MITDLQRIGAMKNMNAEFKAAREAGTVMRYRDLLYVKKPIMLEAIAMKAAR